MAGRPLCKQSGIWSTPPLLPHTLQHAAASPPTPHRHPPSPLLHGATQGRHTSSKPSRTLQSECAWGLRQGRHAAGSGDGCSDAALGRDHDANVAHGAQVLHLPHAVPWAPCCPAPSLALALPRALFSSGTAIKFGLAFCEASGERKIRWGWGWGVRGGGAWGAVQWADSVGAQRVGRMITPWCSSEAARPARCGGAGLLRPRGPAPPSARTLLGRPVRGEAARAARGMRRLRLDAASLACV